MRFKSHSCYLFIIWLPAFCVLFLFPENIKAQANASIKENNPGGARNLSISGTILGIDVYNPNLNFFIDGNFSYRFKGDRVWIKAHYKQAYIDRNEQVIESDSREDAVPAKGTQPLKSIGGSIGYNFIKKETYSIARATFSNRLKSISLPIKSYRLYGIHAGYESFRTINAQGSTTSYTGTIHQGLPHDTTVVVGNATPMLNMKIISLGIHRQIIEHYDISVNDGGTSTNYAGKSCSTVYADFLIGTNIVFDDILVPLNEAGPNANPTPSSYYGSSSAFNFYRADINNSYRKIPVGGRLGWEYTSLKSVGYYAGAEIGFRPGIVDPIYNLYLLFKVGISFNAKAK